MRGVSLLEVVIGMALLALGFIFVLGIVPTSVTAVKRSEDIAAATAYGLEMLEDARRVLPSQAIREMDITFNATEFKVRREIVTAGEGLSDIVVTITWTQDKPPIKLVTRVRGTAPGMRP